jgi:hypothetical protein
MRLCDRGGKGSPDMRRVAATFRTGTQSVRPNANKMREVPDAVNAIASIELAAALLMRAPSAWALDDSKYPVPDGGPPRCDTTKPCAPRRNVDAGQEEPVAAGSEVFQPNEEVMTGFAA